MNIDMTSALAGRRSLVVQDHDLTALALKRTLSQAGYLADEADLGVDGLMLAADHAYALMLVDDCLPDMDGFSLMSRLRSRGYAGPIFFTTTNWDFAQAAVARGAHRSIMIPYEVGDTLLEALRAL